MSDDKEIQVRQAEERLRTAMLHSDVNALDALLDPELLFTTHFGQVIGKQDDLTTHRLGVLKLQTVDYSDQIVRMCGDMAIVSVRVHISGVFGAAFIDGLYRFTRVWSASPEGAWRVIAGHVCEIK